MGDMGDMGGISATIRWGILGAGDIASAFCGDLVHAPGHSVVAVGARVSGASDAFADRWGIERRHGSYVDLVEDPDVDVVYVATPHPFHHDVAMLAIEAGKAVLVEKPFTMDATQARALVTASRARGTFLMEAMWTRFLPSFVAIREVIASGRLGELVLVTAELGQWFPHDVEHRLFNGELGGGALLDLGIYPVSFASMVLGSPTRITAVSDPTTTGVDAQTSMILSDDAGRHAVITTTLRATTPSLALISGTEARIEIEGNFYNASAFSIIGRDGSVERVAAPRVGHGLWYEAAEVGRCLRAGLTESPVMPLMESISIMETLDEVRRHIGLTYPGLAR